MSTRTLEHALTQSRAIVCAGTGGVGKTTMSAALATAAALSGRNTLVLTIDPARRLADAFGLSGIDHTATAVDLSGLTSPATARGDQALTGKLDAMMLAPKSTFDALVDRFAESEAAKRRILDNRIYQHLSETLAGSTEYAAMIQVHELVEEGKYDLIVVDTPPADHALDFLRAPKRMRDFLEGRFVKTLVQPALSATRMSARLIGRGLKRLLELIDRVAGGGFIEDISEFLGAVDGLALGFEEKSQRVEAFLLGPETSFVLISGVQNRSTEAARDFLSRLDDFRIPLAAVLINRMHPWSLGVSPQELLASERATAADAKCLSQALGTEGIGEEIAERLQQAAHVFMQQEAEASRLEEAAASRGVESRRIPELDGDIDRLDGLVSLSKTLLDDDPVQLPSGASNG